MRWKPNPWYEGDLTLPTLMHVGRSGRWRGNMEECEGKIRGGWCWLRGKTMVRPSQHTMYRMELSGEEIKHDRYEDSSSVLTVPPLCLQRYTVDIMQEANVVPRYTRAAIGAGHLLVTSYDTHGKRWVHSTRCLYGWMIFKGFTISLVKKIIFYHFPIDLARKGILSNEH